MEKMYFHRKHAVLTRKCWRCEPVRQITLREAENVSRVQVRQLGSTDKISSNHVLSASKLKPLFLPRSV